LTEGKQAPAPAPSHQASNDDLSGMEHWHPELFAKLQRRRCLTEGKQAPHGQLEAIAARHESERERLLCAQRARLRAADRKPVRMARASTGATRTGLSMAKPFAAVSYDPSSSGQERSEGAEAAAEAADGSLLDYQAATCSAHAVQVFDIMEASEGFDEHDESDDDDGGFGALETLLPREVSRRGLEACKIVNLIDLAESDMDTASTCSSLEMTQDIGRCWERAESDSRNREIQYLQQMSDEWMTGGWPMPRQSRRSTGPPPGRRPQPRRRPSSGWSGSMLPWRPRRWPRRARPRCGGGRPQTSKPPMMSCGRRRGRPSEHLCRSPGLRCRDGVFATKFESSKPGHGLCHKGTRNSRQCVFCVEA